MDEAGDEAEEAENIVSRIKTLRIGRGASKGSLRNSGANERGRPGYIEETLMEARPSHTGRPAAFLLSRKEVRDLLAYLKAEPRTSMTISAFQVHKCAQTRHRKSRPGEDFLLFADSEYVHAYRPGNHRTRERSPVRSEIGEGSHRFLRLPFSVARFAFVEEETGLRLFAGDGDADRILALPSRGIQI